MSTEQSTANVPGLRAVVYVRMTTTDQKDSPGRQRGQCIPYVEAKGYKLVADPLAEGYPYQDLGIRGSDADRPGFKRLMADAVAGRFDVIVCDEFSRLSRQEPEDFIADVMRPLKRAGVTLDLVKEGPKSWDGLGSLITLAVHSDASSGESKNIAHRVHSNARARVEKGQPAGGRAPYGYRWEYRQVMVGNAPKLKPVRLVPDGDRADVVRRLFEDYSSGAKTVLGIADGLAAAGVAAPCGGEGSGKPLKAKPGEKPKTPKTGRWTAATIRGILRNDTYVGRSVYGRQTRSAWTEVKGGVVHQRKISALPQGRDRMPVTDTPEETWVVSETPHEALVTQALFDSVQGRLAKNRRGNGVGDRKDFVLSGILVCENCGRTLRACKGRSAAGIVYRCPSNLSRVVSPCNNGCIGQAEALEAIVSKMERDFILTPERREFALKRLRQQENEGRKPENVAKLTAEIGKIDATVRRAAGNLALLEPDEIPAARQRINELKASRASFAAELAEAQGGGRVDIFKECLVTLANAVLALRRVVNDGTSQPEALRTLLVTLVSSVSVAWVARRPKNPNSRYLRRVPAGGVIYLSDWFASFLAALHEVTPEEKDLEVYTFSGHGLTDDEAGAGVLMPSMTRGVDEQLAAEAAAENRCSLQSGRASPSTLETTSGKIGVRYVFPERPLGIPMSKR